MHESFVLVMDLFVNSWQIEKAECAYVDHELFEA